MGEFLYNLSWHDAIGLAGAGLYLISYTLLQLKFINSDGGQYATLNLIAASAILFSLSQQFNLASAVINASWIVISLVGLGLRLRPPRARARPRKETQVRIKLRRSDAAMDVYEFV